jgi:hypothetical protein
MEQNGINFFSLSNYFYGSIGTNELIDVFQNFFRVYKISTRRLIIGNRLLIFETSSDFLNTVEI